MNTDRASQQCDCEPFVNLPAWWSSFLFQIFSPRQLAVYTYLAMLGVKDGISTPTIRQIQDDMGLASDTMVYEALRALEDGALIRRIRVRNDGGIGQNGYRRPACESTLIQLLEKDRIDHHLRPLGPAGAEAQSDDVTELAREGLESILADAFPAYAAAPRGERRAVLLELLRASLAQRARPDGKTCACDLGDPDDSPQA